MLLLDYKESERILIKDEDGNTIVTIHCIRASRGKDRPKGKKKLGFEADAKYRIEREKVEQELTE
jgi:hypothetical protein